MVVKVIQTSSSSSSAVQKTAQRVLKKYRFVGRTKKMPNSSSVESYWRLKRIVPTISSKENISKLDVVLEAISYIQHLQGNLQAAAVLASSSSTMDSTRIRQC